MRTQKGFTLIEIMVTVAVVAILSAIAIPSYTDYIRRARITEATSILGTMRLKMEQYFQDNRTYAQACQPNTVAALPAPTGYFTFACANLTATGYTMTATGIAGTNMTGFTYQMDMNVPLNTGFVMSTPVLPTGWTVKPTCWVLKKDGSC